MSEDAAILAQFSDWRTVKGRKVLQLIFEVPLEDQAKVLTHLGAPMPMADLWCGIARVARKGKAGDAPNREGGDKSGVAVAPSIRASSPAPSSVTPGGGETGGSPSPLSLAPPVPKHKRRWSEMPPSQRAALLTGDPEFWRYLGTCGVHEPETATAADTSLKFLCGIQSKRELDEREKAASAFERLHGNFKAWQSARGHGVI